MLLSELLEDSYLPSRLGTSEGNARQARFAVELFSRWVGQPATLADLPKTARFLLAYAKEHSPQTVNAKRAYLLALWRHAAKEHGASNPTTIRRMPEKIDPPQAWTVEELSRIVAACRKCRGKIEGILASRFMESLILAAYDTGARIGQLLQTKSNDVSLHGRQMLLRAACAKDGRGRLRELSPDTVAALLAIWQPSRELVWPWNYSPEAMQGRINRILDWAKVSHGRGHGGNFHKISKTTLDDIHTTYILTI